MSSKAMVTTASEGTLLDSVKDLTEGVEKKDSIHLVHALNGLFDAILAYKKGDKKDVAIFQMVASTMTAFPNDEDIQWAGCNCLSASSIVTKVHRYGSSLVVLTAGMVSVAKALARFPDSVSVQSNGFIALANMVSHASVEAFPLFGLMELTPSQRPHYKEYTTLIDAFVQEWKGMELTKNAMEAYPTVEKLQRSCILLLVTIARCSPDNCAAVKVAGFGSLVGAALDNDRTNAKLASVVREYFSVVTE